MEGTLYRQLLYIIIFKARTCHAKYVASRILYNTRVHYGHVAQLIIHSVGSHSKHGLAAPVSAFGTTLDSILIPRVTSCFYGALNGQELVKVSHCSITIWLIHSFSRHIF